MTGGHGGPRHRGAYAYLNGIPTIPDRILLVMVHNQRLPPDVEAEADEWISRITKEIRRERARQKKERGV